MTSPSTNRPHPSASRHAGLPALRSALQHRLDGECDFSDAGLALYTSDASNYRQVPLGVVFPRHADDVCLAVNLCREHDIPLLMRGGGTSQNGQCVNEAMILDCSRHMTRVLDIDVQNRTACVEPGVICDSLKAAAERHGLTFGPDPATHSRCTLGGMIGNNSCGPRSMLAGKTVENVLELEIVTPDGERLWVGPTSEQALAEIIQGSDARARIYRQLKTLRDEHAEEIRRRYPDIKRRVSGYNLDQLLPENGFNVARALVGSEGSCVSILQARVKLIENPACRRLIVLGFPDIYMAGDSVPEIMPFAPIAMEGLDWNIIGGLQARQLKQREIALLPEGQAWLLVELAAANETELQARCGEFLDAMQASARVQSAREILDSGQVQDLWSIREQGASATSMSLDPHAPDPVVGWEDTAVDPMQLGDYLRGFQALVDRYGYTTSLYGHFGDGCIHARITFDTRTEEGVLQWRAFSREIAELVVRYGGSLSGEHGDGQAKGEFLPVMFGEQLMQAFREFKAIWDPRGGMNPGKLIDAYRMDENLRFGPDYQRPDVHSPLHFVEDVGGFARTTERCIGMGKCRSLSGAMCPSYQASGEERFSTRGRAHLLHELVRGEVIRDGWQDTDIAESLEHCLSCKACKSECPTQVDIATWKAHFMAEHHATRRRPLHHHVFGRIGTHLPRLARLPGLVNALQRGPGGKLARSLLGISAEKRLPALSQPTFRHWAGMHVTQRDDAFDWFGDDSAKAVVLWADSVNTHYRAPLLSHAISVMNKAGFRVAMARQHFCCGRPLYEYGLLDEARRQLDNILSHFHTSLPTDTEVVVLEPSCLSVFRDEMMRLFPDDSRARDLHGRVMTLSALLTRHAVQPRRTLPDGILHLHCHDKAAASSEDRSWMRACFARLQEPESGCCGMAGTFGMRRKTRELGLRLFSRRLGPAAAEGGEQTLIVTNGFSCHEQFLDHGHATVLHPVEVLDRCL